MRFVFLFLIVFFLVGAVFVLRDPESWVPSEDAFRSAAANAHVRIGEVDLVLPLVSISQHGLGHDPDDPRHVRRATEDRRAAFRAASDDPADPVKLDRTTLTLATYGWSLESGAASVVCPLLQRDWAKAICDDPWSPLRQALPRERIEFVDLRKLDQLGGYTTLGGESLWDQVGQMRLHLSDLGFVCDKVQRFQNRHCSAGVYLDGTLAAVWFVGGPDVEAARAKAEREAKAIRAFFQFGLGQEEQFETLEAIACDLRAADAEDHPNRPARC